MSVEQYPASLQCYDESGYISIDKSLPWVHEYTQSHKAAQGDLLC